MNYKVHIFNCDIDILLKEIIQDLEKKCIVVLMKENVKLLSEHMLQKVLTSFSKKEFDFLVFPIIKPKKDEWDNEIVPVGRKVSKYCLQMDDIDDFNVIIFFPEERVIENVKKILYSFIMKEPLDSFIQYFREYTVWCVFLGGIFGICKRTIFTVSRYNNSFMNIDLQNEINNIFRVDDTLSFKQISL